MATKKQRTAPAQVSHAESARQIGFLIRKFYQKNQAIWQALCVDDQMTSVQSATLSVVHRDGPCSLTALGRAAAMDPATTRGVVERLRVRGMISLIGDAADRRKVIVQLEQPARDYLAAMASAMPRIAEATLNPLNPAERVALEYLLLKVTASD
jgi:DNA-binding MarR family transcriptional regulator